MADRIPGIDIARSAAIAGMVAYHFVYDLDLFGYVPQGTAVTGIFWWQARIVAATFIFLAGVSLWLSHGQGFRPEAYWRRLGRLAAAAVLVSVVTWFALPGLTIFYGILHSLVVSSLLCLLLLRVPALVTLALAAAAFALPFFFTHPLFNGWLIWTGLGTVRPVTADFLPLFPWIAPMLTGLALARLADRARLIDRFRRPDTPLARALAWPGRHSLAIYLIHQPVLISLFWLVTQVLR